MFGESPEAKIRVGVVGVGVLGRYHTKIYSESKNAELVGVYDLNPKCAAAVAAEFHTRPFATIRELAEQCDALSVAVPATGHHAAAMELMAMNKHILMEKPLAVTVAEAIVIRQFVHHPQVDEECRRQSDDKPQDVEGGEQQAPPDKPERHFQIMFQHIVSVFIHLSIMTTTSLSFNAWTAATSGNNFFNCFPL